LSEVHQKDRECRNMSDLCIEVTISNSGVNGLLSNKRLAVGYSSQLSEESSQTVSNQVLLLYKSFMIDKGNNSICVKLVVQTSWTGFVKGLCTSDCVETAEFLSP